MKHCPLLLLLLFLLPHVAATQNGNEIPQKILVTSTMVVPKTAGPGTASGGALFDGNTSTFWFPGWPSVATYPAVVMLDLGKEMKLVKIRVYDGAGISKLTFSSSATATGVPLEFFSLSLDRFQQWTEHTVDHTQRFLFITLSEPQGDQPVGEIELYSGQNGNNGITPPVLSQSRQDADKINLCGFHWAPLDKLSSFRSQRIFQMSQWTWRPGNKIAVEPSWQANANYDTYLTSAKKQGMIIIPCISQTPDWMLQAWGLGSDADIAPAKPGMSKTDPAAYKDFAAYWFQITARYGRKKWDASFLQVETTPRWIGDVPTVPKTGLDLLQFMEVWNEPDKWWKPALYMEPEQYCAMLSSCYDGHEGTLGTGHGIKTADPTMQVVMAGLTGLTKDYLDRMLVWAKANRKDKRLPFDIANVHHYSNKANSEIWPPTWTEGTAPELDARFYKLKAIASWAHNLGLPLWFTEFGYDTKLPSWQYITPFAGRSNEDIKGDWIARIYLEALSAGVDNMFLFNAIDEPGAANGGLYQTSGILKGEQDPTPFAIKPAYTAIVNLINELNGYTYSGDLSTTPTLRILLFKGKKDTKLAMWSPTAAGKTLEVNIGWAKMIVSETPRFVLISEGPPSGP